MNNSEHRLFSKIFTSLLYAVCIILIILVGMIMIKYAVEASETSVSDGVYMICDVYDIVYNGSTVEIDIVLPNKTLLTRQLSVDYDLPESFNEVVVYTVDLDDYATYKIVGVR